VPLLTPAVTTHVFPRTTPSQLSLDEPIADLRGVAIRLRDQSTPPQRAVRLHFLPSRLTPTVAPEAGADLIQLRLSFAAHCPIRRFAPQNPGPTYARVYRTATLPEQKRRATTNRL